jgi:DNA-binding transcriptional regulator YhcF (GntR family)
LPRSHGAPITFRPDPESRQPLYRQLIGWLREAIRSGKIPPGSLLPSTRALARHLGISRNTVLDAYAGLEEAALVAGSRGSGTRVLGDAAARLRARATAVDYLRFLRASHYPTDAVPLTDPDGNPLYVHR